jgi:hypothetical protein
LLHSLNVSKAAEANASYHPALDPGAAFVLGCLHDIGRRAGITEMRHVIDGSNFLLERGFDDAARICLTHSFPILNVEAAFGGWGCTKEEYCFVRTYLEEIELNEYGRLIQLGDALAMPTGFVIVEKRFVDVALRYGLNEYSLSGWQAYLKILQHFEHPIGCPVYSILPGIIENSVGFNPKTGQT